MGEALSGLGAGTCVVPIVWLVALAGAGTPRDNAADQVIRVFSQHYKTFCRFHSIESTRLHLRVFEKGYRFTHSSDDAQGRIRGRSPLGLAQYDVQDLPTTLLSRGLALQWPTQALRHLVPGG